MKLVNNTNQKKDIKKISDQEAENAFRTILTWIGENPSREGLLETPKRVVKAFKEYFKGYKEDPNIILDKTFGDVEGYDDMVVQKNILKAITKIQKLFLIKLLEMWKATVIWLFKKIFLYKVIANIIWHQ